MESKYQSFEAVTISRKQIKNAEYNPRIITKEAKKRLQKSLKKHGLVSAITWNARTGNVVGGHQRLAILDTLEGSDDYDLTVCQIDVSERDEAEINVQLNNPSMQGEWDVDMLGALSDEFGLDLISDLNFDTMDVAMMFDDQSKMSPLYQSAAAEDSKEKLKEIKEARQQGTERLKERNEINWYTTIVFRSEEDRREFHNQIGVPEEEIYITQDQMERIKNE